MSCTPECVSINSLIAKAPLFEGVAVDELADIACFTRKIVAPRGEILFRKNEACNGLYLIVSGQVKIFFSSALGNEKILDILGESAVLGESALYQGGNYQFYAQTLSESILLHIAKPAMLALLDKNPRFARRVIGNLSQIAFGLTQDVESYSLHSGRQRVINYLVHEAVRANAALQDLPLMSAKDQVSGEWQSPLVISLPTSKGVIASYLNLTQEHFSRILHDLSAGGLLSVSGRDIHIENFTQFRQCAGEAVLLAEGVPLNRSSPLAVSDKPPARNPAAGFAAANKACFVA